MHALRAHCGSYLHDSLRQHWLTEEERRAMEERDSPGVQSPTCAADSVSGGDDQKECDREGPAEVSSFPQQWPLFGSPTLTTIRVTSYRDVGGTIVSWTLVQTQLCMNHKSTYHGLHTFCSIFWFSRLWKDFIGLWRKPTTILHTCTELYVV